MLLHIYFWFMLVYVVATLVATPLMARRSPHLVAFSKGAWLEQGFSYILLGLGLLGTYGFLHSEPILNAMFWQCFLLVLAVFAAFQHRMPKTKQLRATHGPKAVIVSTVVGIVMLLPMFTAIGLYAFGTSPVWADGLTPRSTRPATASAAWPGQAKV